MKEHVGHEAPEKFIVVPLHFFGSTSTISRFGERFRDGKYSLVSLLFAVFLLAVPHVPYWVGAAVYVHSMSGFLTLQCCSSIVKVISLKQQCALSRVFEVLLISN